jgi:hypothetical protein
MATDLRQNVSFNREWVFQLGDVPGADAMVFDGGLAARSAELLIQSKNTISSQRPASVFCGSRQTKFLIGICPAKKC